MYTLRTLENFAKTLPDEQRLPFEATIPGLATVTRNGLSVVLYQELVRAGWADFVEQLEDGGKWRFLTPVNQLQELSEARVENPHE